MSENAPVRARPVGTPASDPDRQQPANRAIGGTVRLDTGGDGTSASHPVAPAFGDRLLEWLLQAAAAWERARQRRRLRFLCEDPDFLRDVGLSRDEALREASRPFWRC